MIEKIQFIKVDPQNDLAPVVKVLNESHLTVAQEFGFTREDNPTNNAFIDAETLNHQLKNGIELFLFQINKQPAGCIAVEKSQKEPETFYIEKVSIIPVQRHKGYGVKLMDYAVDQIRLRGGKRISIALIDKNLQLKSWYTDQGFAETGTRDFSHLPFRVCFMQRQL
jgi:diamine N-acetyltransferase